MVIGTLRLALFSLAAVPILRGSTQARSLIQSFFSSLSQISNAEEASPTHHI